MMTTTRRGFVKTSVAITGSAIAAGVLPSPGAAESPAPRPAASRRRVGRAPAPLNILILGGTGFTGPEQVEYAIARGHPLTLFNPPPTRPRLPGPGGGGGRAPPRPPRHVFHPRRAAAGALQGKGRGRTDRRPRRRHE